MVTIVDPLPLLVEEAMVVSRWYSLTVLTELLPVSVAPLPCMYVTRIKPSAHSPHVAIVPPLCPAPPSTAAGWIT